MLLELDGVKKQYGGFELECSLKVPEGCVTGLIGQNGAGKTTTFKAILELVPADAGSIRVLGKDIRELRAADKEKIGVVFADSGFSQYLTVEMVAKIMKAMYGKFSRKSFLDKCTYFKLPLNKKIKEFSNGMRSKLKLLLALSFDAKLLILDEPTAGLDVIARDELLDMLRDYMKVDGRGILISSHISGDLESLCDDVYMIHDGKIVMHEETDVILGAYGVLKVDEKQYGQMDKSHILRTKKERFGYMCLTDKRQYYVDNYPDIVVEKGSIDSVVTLVVKGETI